MSRDLRKRLESAQAKVKELERSLPSIDLSTPLPEHLSMLESLRQQTAACESELAVARDRRDVAKQERDVASRAVLRLESVPSVSVWSLAFSLVSGLVAGLVLVVAWFDTPLARAFPLAAIALSFTLSAALLLRSAWRIGRVSGARGP